MQGPPFDKTLSPGSPIWYKFCFHMFHYRTLLTPWLKYPYILSVCYLWIEYSENKLLPKTLSRTPGTTLRTTALFEWSAKQLELFALESHRQLSQFSCQPFNLSCSIDLWSRFSIPDNKSQKTLLTLIWHDTCQLWIWCAESCTTAG